MRGVIGILFFTLIACGQTKVKDGLTQDEAFPAHFSEIRSRIIVPRCAGCHEQMLSHSKLVDEYIIPGQPDASRFYTEVESGGMPLYGDKLLDEQITAIRTWIEQGAHLD